jgi:hypothetical protein
MKLYVSVSEVCTYSEREPEEYGSWEEQWDFSVVAVHREKPETLRGWWDGEVFDVPFEVAAGDTVYVLSMVYNTGDSFGRAEGKGEVLWVFKDEALALAAESVWEKSKEQHSVEFVIDDGKKIKISNPGSGYFETITYVNVESFQVN